ncbi:MAG: CRTAC1 family protein [Acidobacteria bacterium]|nr:CRTAC1 family protein [Acidobacteriota bacterium]MBW4044652.1 CRTAC1 family protein [Acidobacteriota bacterium]
MRLSLFTTCALTVALSFVSGCRQTDGRKPVERSQTAAKHTGSTAASPATQAAISAAADRPLGPVQFVDVTREAGIHFKHNNGAFGKKYLPETMGSGVCVLDYDNDGRQDILFVNSADWPGHGSAASFPALYHNNGDGTFTDRTREAGLASSFYGMGCAAGDYDNDGREDIYITAVGSNHLFHNLGNGRFADVTKKAGVGGSGFSSSAVWVDYDNDGKLDLFVEHYVTWSAETDQTCSLDGKNKSYCTPQVYKGESNHLYHNRGDGTFEDVTQKAGLYDPTSKSMGVALLDYDNDGWLDLLVTNDTEPNKLYRNNHNGTFTDVGVQAGVAYSEAGATRAGMGVDVGDYQNSGQPGAVIGNFSNEGLALYSTDGAGIYSEQSSTTGIDRWTNKVLTFSTFFFDYNLDGLMDVLAVNGHVADDVSVTQPSISYKEPTLLFRNEGHGSFENVSNRTGPALQQPIVGRGAAYGDFDNDGDLDLVITAGNGPARLLRNMGGNQNDMLRVRLVGTRSNRDAIGAVAILVDGGSLRLQRMVKGGSGYLSQSELPLTFGLGKPDSSRLLKLSIVWPRGRREQIADIKPNQSLTIVEGKGIVASEPIDLSGKESNSHGAAYTQNR